MNNQALFIKSHMDASFKNGVELHLLFFQGFSTDYIQLSLP